MQLSAPKAPGSCMSPTRPNSTKPSCPPKMARGPQVKTLILKWGRSSSAISHPFLLAAHNLNARCWLQPPLRPQRQESPRSAGTWAQSCAGHPLLPPLHRTDVTVQDFFSCYAAASEETDIWIMWRRKCQQRSYRAALCCGMKSN